MSCTWAGDSPWPSRAEKSIATRQYVTSKGTSASMRELFSAACSFRRRLDRRGERRLHVAIRFLLSISSRQRRTKWLGIYSFVAAAFVLQSVAILTNRVYSMPQFRYPNFNRAPVCDFYKARLSLRQRRTLCEPTKNPTLFEVGSNNMPAHIECESFCSQIAIFPFGSAHLNKHVYSNSPQQKAIISICWLGCTLWGHISQAMHIQFAVLLCVFDWKSISDPGRNGAVGGSTDANTHTHSEDINPIIQCWSIF